MGNAPHAGGSLKPDLQARQGWGDSSPSRARSHLFGAQVRIACRADRRRPHLLDTQRCPPEGGEQRRRRGDGGAQRPGVVPAGGRAQARSWRRRRTASPPRLRVGFDRARVSGAHGRPCDRRNGGEPSSPDDGQVLLCGDLAGAGPRRTGHRRCNGAHGTARSGNRRADLDAGRNWRGCPSRTRTGQEGFPRHAKGGSRVDRTIRFFDPEWARVEAFAETRGIAGAEFVRFATSQRSRTMAIRLPGSRRSSKRPLAARTAGNENA